MNVRLKELRTTLGLTLDKFGERLGVKKNTVSQWESGKNSISESMLKMICREFNVNYFWLTEGTGDMFVALPETALDEIAEEYELNDFEKDMVRKYLQLNKNERKVLMDFIKSIQN